MFLHDHHFRQNCNWKLAFDNLEIFSHNNLNYYHYCTLMIIQQILCLLHCVYRIFYHPGSLPFFPIPTHLMLPIKFCRYRISFVFLRSLPKVSGKLEKSLIRQLKIMLTKSLYLRCGSSTPIWQLAKAMVQLKTKHSVTIYF